MIFPKRSRWPPIFFTFLTSLTHHLSMVKFSEKKSMLENFARTSLRLVGLSLGLVFELGSLLWFPVVLERGLALLVRRLSTIVEIWFDSWGWVGIVASGIKDLRWCYSWKTCFSTACTASFFGPLRGLYNTGDYPYYSECVASPKLAGHHQTL